MKWLTIVFLFVALATGPFSAANAADTALSVRRCSSINSIKTSVREIARSPQRFLNKCVTVTGLMYGSFVYHSVDGVYLPGSSVYAPTTNGLTLGIRNIEDNSRVGDGLQYVEMVGRIGNCDVDQAEARAESNNDIIVMVAGYCHYYSGPYLDVDRVVPTGRAIFTRQLNRAGRANYGNLRPVPADWPHRARVAKAANDFLDALRRRDVAVLANMHFTNNVGNRQDEIKELTGFLLDAPDSPFAEIRASVEAPETIFLAEHVEYKKPKDSDEPPYIDEEDYSSTICFCRKGACDGRWPIATFDADNLATRPYACVLYRPYGQLEPSWSIYRTPMEPYGLLEPRWAPSASTIVR